MKSNNNGKTIKEFKPHQPPKTHHFFQCKNNCSHNHNIHMLKKKMRTMCGNDVFIRSHISFLPPFSLKVVDTHVDI